MKATSFILPLLAVTAQTLAHPSTNNLSFSKLQVRQSAISWHQWENLFGNGQWCFWWCSRKSGNASPSPVTENENNTSIARAVETVQENGDSATKYNSFAAIATKTVAARHDSDIPSEITVPATTVNSTADIVVAPTFTCSEPRQTITAKDRGELHCPVAAVPTDYRPGESATTDVTSTTSTAPTFRGTSSSAASTLTPVSAGEMLMSGSTWVLCIGAMVVGSMSF